MKRSSVTWNGQGANISGAGMPDVEVLAVQIGKLLRHPAYRRETVVSPLLLRHLPFDPGYAWNGEARLRTQLAAAALDAASLEHLIRNVRAELLRLRRPADA